MQLKLNDSSLAHVNWQHIALGSSNKIFKGLLQDQQVILRLNADTDFAFGVDRIREQKVLTLIESQDWAPFIIKNNLQHNWCLMSDHGNKLILNEQSRQDLLKVLAQLQCLSRDVEEPGAKGLYFDHNALFDRYIKIFATSELSGSAIELCHLLKVHLESLPKVDDVLMHQDLHPGNVCRQNYADNGTNQITLIDWEYAGWGSPWLDAAALHTHFSIAVDQLAALPSFNRLSASLFITGLNKALLFNQGIDSLWYYLRFQLQVDRGEIQLSQQRKIKAEMDQKIESLLIKLAGCN